MTPADLLAELMAAQAPSTGSGQPTPPMVSHLAGAKVVRKGWGEERWLIAEGAPFGFKFIYIRAEHRTSLQFHEHKEECNLVLRGEAVLHYAERAGEPVRTRHLRGGDIVHVRPATVHRIEALTDVVLVEASTPELDDVVRLQDDWDRGSGRIEAEHAPGAEHAPDEWAVRPDRG